MRWDTPSAAVGKGLVHTRLVLGVKASARASARVRAGLGLGLGYKTSASTRQGFSAGGGHSSPRIFCLRFGLTIDFSMNNISWGDPSFQPHC